MRRSHRAARPVRPAVGVAAIVLCGDRVLMGLRCGSHGAGSWQFPGGHLEFGESVLECARREVAEETGVAIVRPRPGPFTNDVFAAEGRHYLTAFVLADYAGGIAQVREPDKALRWGWFGWGEFPAPLFLPVVNLLDTGFNPFTGPHAAAPADSAGGV